MDPGLPATEISGTISAHVALASAIEAVTDEVARRPSLLPDWSVGHVLTHLARNADSVVRRLQAAAEGRVVDQYAGGAEGRKQDIEAGAGRPAGALVADVLRGNAEVEAVLAGYPEGGWDHLCRSVTGAEQPAPRLAPWG